MISSNLELDKQSVKAKFCFVQWTDLYNIEKPFQLLMPVPDNVEDKRVTNLIWKDEEIDVQDIRQSSLVPDLDVHGFAIRHATLPKIDFSDKHSVEQAYLPEVQRLIRKEVDDVGQIFVFDWRLRNALPLSAPDTILDLNDRVSFLRPATHPHVGKSLLPNSCYTTAFLDQSPIGAVNRVLMQLKDQSASLLKGRFRIINVWRPLVDVVEDWPLAFCDSSTVEEEDLIESDFIRRHYTGSTMFLQNRPYHKFYYLSRQTKDDVVFLKQFDSLSIESKASRCPHGSFQLPNYNPARPSRVSVEVRCLVFSSTEAAIPLGFHEMIKSDVLDY